MKVLAELTHRGVTVCHYLENKKYMNWYYKAGEPMKTVGIIQVRGISEPLTEKELKTLQPIAMAFIGIRLFHH